MKTALLFLVITVVVCSGEPGLGRDRHEPPYINRPKPPTTTRFRRSPEPEPQGSIVLQGTKPLDGPERRPSYSLDYQHKIYEGKNGHISAGGGALKLPGERVQPHIGVQGTWRFRRSPQPDPQGSIVFQGTKPLSGAERRPTYSLDYQHNIFEGKNGHISAGGGALKLPGERVQPHIGVQGTWRFRRDVDQELVGDLVEEQ